MNLEPSGAGALAWGVSGWWRGPGAVIAVTSLGVASLVLAAWAAHEASQSKAKRNVLELQLASLRSDHEAPSLSIGTSARDFTVELPASASPAPALAVLQSAAARARVTVESVQAQELTPSQERLGRVQLSISARGSYANLKRWMSEVNERVPATTVSRLQMQRADGAAEVEARLTLFVWSRSAAAMTKAERD